jgi:hypothetical protein
MLAISDRSFNGDKYMHTTLALSPAQSELIARLATAVEDMNNPPRPEYPAELVTLRQQILNIVDRDG